jgi:hypothetical protein
MCRVLPKLFLGNPIEVPHEGQRTLCRIDTIFQLAGGRSKVRGFERWRKSLSKVGSSTNHRSVPA